MGGEPTDGGAAERMQHLSEAVGRCRRESVGGYKPNAETHMPVFRFYLPMTASDQDVYWQIITTGYPHCANLLCLLL
jgi:hypothetical protein